MTVPWPEGSAQTPPTAQQMMVYIDQLGAWIGQSRLTLDRLDQKIRSADQGQGVHDMAMTLTVWQAIKDRHTDLLTVWDSGRVTDVELKKLAVMTWANLNDMLTPGTTLSSGGGLAVSLPEACRMLEALIAQLSSRYQLVPQSGEASARIAQLRAQVERIREQVGLDSPADQARTMPLVADLQHDVADMIAKADRGGDIGGLIGPLEVRSAQLERDLIVGHAQRAMMQGRVAQARSRLAGLAAREHSVADLVRATAASVTPAPKYAVPRVEALGPVPTTATELDQFEARLSQVGQALDIVQQANLKARARKDDLITRFQRAQALTAPDDAVGDDLARQITTLLASTPAPLDVIEPLITAYEASRRRS
ncbi:MAG: hypothetical protein LBV00_01030 [Propionibacteriaceae bacterium]|jgi:hypothetical protein|nr:hypothetical protein [Propionibacteriaceae bacterium]